MDHGQGVGGGLEDDAYDDDEFPDVDDDGKDGEAPDDARDAVGGGAAADPYAWLDRPAGPSLWPGAPAPGSARPTRPRRRRTSEKRRREILDALIPVFTRHGLEATTVAMLEAAAPVSRPVLYHYFPSKTAMYVAALEREAQRVEARFEDFAGRVGDDAAFVAGTLRWARMNDETATFLLHRPLGDAEARAAHAALRARVVRRRARAAALQGDRSIAASRGLQRRFALEIRAAAQVGALEATVLWALAHPFVTVVKIAEAWVTP